MYYKTRTRQCFPFLVWTFLLLSVTHAKVKEEDKVHYHLMKNWPQDGTTFNYGGKELNVGQMSGVDIVSNQTQVVLLHRADRSWGWGTFKKDNTIKKEYQQPIEDSTLIWLARDTGKVIKVGGEGLFYLPHGITIDDKGFLWITDVGSHQMYKLTPDLKVVMTLGVKFKPGNGENYFCKPTSVVVMATGDFFVGDGYCNQRVIKFNEEGEILHIISAENNPHLLPKPNYMFIVHSLTLNTKQDQLFVADRENGRVLMFDTDTGGCTGEIKSPHGAVYAVAFNPHHNGMLHFVTGPMHDVKGSLWGYTYSLKSNSVVSKWSPKKGFKLPHDIAVSQDNTNLFVTDIKSPPFRVWEFQSTGSRTSQTHTALVVGLLLQICFITSSSLGS